MPSRCSRRRRRRAAKRVVALEWDALENLVALGVKPVGAADLRGFRQYVAVALPGGITDVGMRQEPSIERIAKLRPDLIIVPSNRAGRNLSTLRKIARVIDTNPYPGEVNGAQFARWCGTSARSATPSDGARAPRPCCAR